jgi:GNAT superfamily N-acetyltransferase
MMPIVQASSALAESLMDDPFLPGFNGRFCNRPDGAQERSEALFPLLPGGGRAYRPVRSCSRSNAGCLGVAAARPQEVAAVELSAKSGYLASILGPRGMENYHRIVRYMTALAAQAIPHSVWYLSIVGILPSAQGRGLGATLLAGTLAEASHAHVPCYLETFTPRNLRFYERLGFFVGSRRTANPPRIKTMW